VIHLINWPNESGAQLTQMTTRAILRFVALPLAEKRLFLRAIWWLPVMACATQLLGLRRVQSWIERSTSRRNNKNHTTELDASSVGRMAFCAARYGVVHGNCLSRSLTLCYLLRRHGFDACLRLGARRRGKSLEAHAWVELNGSIYDSADDVRGFFAPFSIHPASELIPQK
jgi:transglutaminase superfamily protein